MSLSLVLSNAATSQVNGQQPGYIRLQSTTPGSQQAGNANISGVSIAGQHVGGGSGLTGVNADLLDGINSTAFLQSVPNPLSLSGFQSASSIISGTNAGTSTGTSGIKGISSGLSGTVYGLWGTSSSVSGRGVFGETSATTGLTFGGRFESDSTSGKGVFGFAKATSGSAYGVQGQTNSDTGRAVYGTAISNTGVNYGGYFSTSSSSGYGVFATSDGTHGLYAEATATSGTTYGVYGLSAGFNGVGVYGEVTSATGANFGGRFRNASTAGVGVSGIATATSGSTMAGRFEVNSTSGRGVFGWALAASGATYGVYGKADSPNGRAVYGDAQGGTAGHFQSASGLGLFCSTGGTGFAMDVQGAGVSALHVSTAAFDVNKAAVMIEGGYEGLRTSGNNTGVVAAGIQYGLIGFDSSSVISGVGVKGSTSSDQGVGVLGTCGISVLDGIGVQGISDDYRGVHGIINNTGSGTSYGVYGESSGATGRGVLGTVSSTAGVNYGVRGVNSNASGYAVYAAGDFGVSGNKAFVIDHPFDPANMYLKHYCMEGPQPKNFYDGTVVTDNQGWATVRLPDYFLEINKEPRVQLTVNDSSEDFVMVKMVGEIQGNTFRVRTSKGRVKVYWEVKATRDDAWNRAHGAPVEVQKSPEERGKYQHPELYGKPATLAVDYDPRAEASRKAAAAQMMKPR